MLRIKKINVMSLGKSMGTILGLIGFVVGIIIAILSFMGIPVTPQQQQMQVSPAIMGTTAVIIFPILYSMIGFTGGIMIAFFYNVTVKFSGGIKLETEEVTT